MATYKVRDPQGNIREISGPDGAPDDEILAQAKRLFSAPQAQQLELGAMADQVPGVEPQRPQLPRPITNDNPNLIDRFLLDKFGGQLAKAPDIQASVPGRFIQGMADLPVGAMQLGMNVAGMGDKVNPEIQAIKQRTEALRGPDAGIDLANVGGNVVTGVVLGAPKAAATAMQRIGQGMAMGAGYGAATPVIDGGEDFAGTKTGQIGTGALIGGLIPAVTSAVGGAYRTGRNLIDPWLPGGDVRAAVRTAETAAGPRRAAVAKALQEFKPAVTGERVGAGEAAARAGSAEFSALQRIAGERMPSEFAEMGRATNQARQAAIQGVGQNEAALAAAQAARNATTGPMRDAALREANIVGVTPDKLVRQIRAIESRPGLRASDVVSKSLGELKDKISGLRKNEFGFVNPQDLYTVRKELGNTISKFAQETKNWDQRLTSGLQRQLQGYIDDAIESAGGKGWKNYLSTYSEMSRPINQMQIGQFLENKLVPALNDQGASASQRGAAYAQALRDAPGTLKTSTGSSRYNDIAEVLTGQQMGAVRGVGESLGRSASYEQLARQGMPAAREMVGQVVPVAPAMGMFNPKYSVLKSISNRLAGKAEGKSLDRLAELMQDPQKLGELMNSVPIAERSALIQAIREYARPAIMSGAATSAASQ